MKLFSFLLLLLAAALLFAACENIRPETKSDVDAPYSTDTDFVTEGDFIPDDPVEDDPDLSGGDDGLMPDDDILLTCDEEMSGEVSVVNFDNGHLDCMMDYGKDKVTELDGSHCGRAVVTCGWRGNVYPFCELTAVSWGQLLTGEPAYSRVELYRYNMQGEWPLWGVWQRDGDLEEIFTGANEACQIVHSIYVVGYHLVFTP